METETAEWTKYKKSISINILRKLISSEKMKSSLFVKILSTNQMDLIKTVVSYMNTKAINGHDLDPDGSKCIELNDIEQLDGNADIGSDEETIESSWVEESSTGSSSSTGSGVESGSCTDDDQNLQSHQYNFKRPCSTRFVSNFASIEYDGFCILNNMLKLFMMNI
eukprot:121555_1